MIIKFMTIALLIFSSLAYGDIQSEYQKFHEEMHALQIDFMEREVKVKNEFETKTLEEKKRFASEEHQLNLKMVYNDKKQNKEIKDQIKTLKKVHTENMKTLKKAFKDQEKINKSELKNREKQIKNAFKELEKLEKSKIRKKK
ncbi:MAG: hypothetical protein JNM93_03885 [Bacteriovoracaceae bacterium]|nr:hypothetical protein [Bacteriovoracaceae bacterium]